MLVLNPDNRVLLFHFLFDEGTLAGRRFWATPGGALKPGESYRQAARRELREETGIVAEIGNQIARREVTFRDPVGEWVIADERYLLIRARSDDIDADGQEPLEASVMREFRWWALGELERTSETVYPEDIVGLVQPHL